MASKKFMVSVADVYAYDIDTDAVVFIGKTLLDSSIEGTVANTDVRAGRGAQLQYIYYQGGDLNITINESQFSLEFLAATVGDDVGTGKDVYIEETVTLGVAGAGAVVDGTPLAVAGTIVYGWVTHSDGTVEKVTFTGANFTSSYGSENDVVCVRYYSNDAAARYVTVEANIVPKNVRLVLEAQLNSADETSNRIGLVQIEIPRAALSGGWSLSLTPDGVASTPIAARAMAFTPSGDDGCASTPVYAYITEILDSANWYDNVVGLAILNGDIALSHPDTYQVEVRAVPTAGAAFRPLYADLTFASATGATATIGAQTGLITTVAGGTSLISCTITAKTAIDASVTLTVS